MRSLGCSLVGLCALVIVDANLYTEDGPHSRLQQPTPGSELRSLEESIQSDSVFQTIHVNCGSSQSYSDPSGKVWTPDLNFDGGEAVAVQSADSIIEGDLDPIVYQTSRVSSSDGTRFSYRFDVPNGDYTIVFHFTDALNSAAGARTFDVWLEGLIVFTDFDIVSLAGGGMLQLIARRRVIVEDGSIDVLFIDGKGKATVSAIEIVERKRAPTVPTPTSPPTSPAPTLLPTMSPTLPPTTSPMTNPPVSIPTPKPAQIIDVGAITESPTTKKPIVAPIAAPILTTTSSPVKPPSTAQPTGRPFLPPTAQGQPFLPPTAQQLPSPTGAPEPISDPSTVFKPLRINTGGKGFVDDTGKLWSRDTYFVGGAVYTRYTDISGTPDDILYASERFGNFRYEIALPVATYEVVMYFAESHYDARGGRQFSIKIQNEVAFDLVDLIALAGGQKSKAVTLEHPAVVSDGMLLIEFVSHGVGHPKMNALEIILSEPHLAHAVAGGPYVAVDVDGDNFATVPLDGSLSHTHGHSLSLTSWSWVIDNQILATGEISSVKLPVGKHLVTLVVKDNGNNENTESTEINVLPGGYPWISSITPETGKLSGGDNVEIYGSGLNGTMVVYFGEVGVSTFTVVDETTIRATSPLASLATPVRIKVQTVVGTSNSLPFTYLDGSPIKFSSEKIAAIASPTTVAFGPDHKLYVGTAAGSLFKLTLDENFNVLETVSSSIIKSVGGSRMILGLAFDPMDVASENPSVYVSHSIPFHKSPHSSSSLATNGKVSKISGANLDAMEDIITGLPVSDHDHAVNGIEFADNGDLYVQVAGSTNSGVPGRLSSTRLLKDNVLSGATLVAHLASPNFSGRLLYDAIDNGNLVPGSGVEIFAYGLRNPYDLVLHSNGRLYGTDNGPNLNFGLRSIGCNAELPDIQEDDKVLLLEKDHYYGYPNRKRGQADPRQCLWRSAADPTDGHNYTGPLVTNPSSIDGIVEFQTDHFGGQLRHNLIVAKYKKELYRIILNEEGTAVLPQSDPPIPLTGAGSLDVTQAPDGSLVVAQYIVGSIALYRPIESGSPSPLRVYGVFPRRGPVNLIPRLTVYYASSSATSINGVTVRVGAEPCPVQSVTSKTILCGPVVANGPGTVDVIVSLVDGSSQTFSRGFRFITGQPDG